MSKITKNIEMQNLRTEFIAQGWKSSTNFYVESAKGAIIRDINGKEYIDFAGGIACMNVGHSNPKVIKVIKDQAEKFTHTCFMVNPYGSAIELAEKLCKIIPGSFPKKALFLNSGSEAIENVVKIARYYTKKPAIIVLENAYHGRTLLTMTMTSKIKPFKLGFGPFAPEIYRMPFGEGLKPEKLKDFFLNYINPESVAALIVEPVQGEGGYYAPPPGYFQELSKICHENDILFVSDEIQSGMGRTGKMFAIEHWNVEPDIIAIGKSIAAGMPLSAVIGRKEIMDSVHKGGLGGTYSANPISCRAAIAVLEVFEEENLLEKSKELGNKLKTRFDKWQKQFDIVGGIRGIGAMLGLELVKSSGKEPATEETNQLISYCLDNGLILLSCGVYGNIIRIMVPFIIEDDQLDEGLSIMENGLDLIS